MERVVFQKTSLENGYVEGDVGVIVGFVNDSEDGPYAIVRRLDNGRYKKVLIDHLIYNGQA